jgi:hypothetical protein
LETRLQEQPSQVTLAVTQAAVTEKGAAA